VANVSKTSPKRNGHTSKQKPKISELGLELRKLRARYIARGGKLLSRRELEREIAELRGG